MNKPEYVQENEMHKVLYDFEIQVNHLISAWPPNQVIAYKKEREPADKWTLLSRQTTE